MQAEAKNGERAGAPRYTVIKVRLHPTEEQAALIEKTFGCCRYLWNRMLADVQEFYAATDVHYIPTPARYKKEAPFLTEVDSQALCTVHQNLRKAFLDFFRAPKRYGYPQFKTKKAGKDSFKVYCRKYHTGPSIVLTEDGVRMPKLGLLKAGMYRKPQDGWQLCSAAVTRTRSGKYHCSLSFKCEAVKPSQTVPAAEKTIGINHSLKHFCVDSNGGIVEIPQWLGRSKEKLTRMQQKLSRMQRGSKNYEEQLQKIRLLHERIANQRKDFIHKESRRIANAWDAACVSGNDLIKLSQKAKGANVMDAGFGMFRECLKYKLLQQGKPCVIVDPYAPTAKTCNACGFVHKGLAVHEKSWLCPNCGAALDREINAARNIRDWGLRELKKQEASA